MKDAVMKSTISDMVLPRMAGAVESLDSLACGGLDQLKAAVPAIAEPTPQLVQSTKRAASGYWDSALQYLSSFTVSQAALWNLVFLRFRFRLLKLWFRFQLYGSGSYF
jgi:hypothetical protein